MHYYYIHYSHYVISHKGHLRAYYLILEISKRMPRAVHEFQEIFNKTVIRLGFCGIQNNQGLGKCFISDSFRLQLITLTLLFTNFYVVSKLLSNRSYKITEGRYISLAPSFPTLSMQLKVYLWILKASVYSNTNNRRPFHKMILYFDIKN